MGCLKNNAYFLLPGPAEFSAGPFYVISYLLVGRLLEPSDEHDVGHFFMLSSRILMMCRSEYPTSSSLLLGPIRMSLKTMIMTEQLITLMRMQTGIPYWMGKNVAVPFVF